MRILLVTPIPPDATAAGAIPVLLAAQLGALAEHHDVTVVTVAGPGREQIEAVERLRAAGVTAHAGLRLPARGAARWRRGGTLVARWAATGRPRRTVWFFEPRVQAILDDLLTRESFDVVAVEDNAMGVYDYRTAVPTVLTEHEVRRPRSTDWSIVRSHPLRGAFSELDWRRWPAYQRRVWQKFDRIQVFSERDRRALAGMAPALAGRVRVNPFGVDVPPAAQGRPRPNTLVFVGNYKHPPNVDAALWTATAILPLVRQRVHDATLAIVGLNAPSELHAVAGGPVEVVGPVPDVAPVLARTAVVLAPVRIGGGMRMKVIHAMAHGKAVVTTPRGAEGLGVDGGRPPVALADDAAGLAAAAAALLEDEARREALGRQAREYVAEHLSAAAYVRRLEATYEDVVAARASLARV